jgi:DNA primase
MGVKLDAPGRGSARVLRVPLMIGQDTIDRIREQTGIVELVGETVKLVRRGRSHVGLCPFHKEKTPSFHVNEERGFYHCFGCAEHGDVFKFVQQIEGLEFVEAVRRLADRSGIQIVENASDDERRRQNEARRRQQELYAVGEAAATYFERMLREHPLAELARVELERRGLVADAPTGDVADTLQAFRLGYAPYAWDALSQHLRESGLSHRAAESVGLLAPRKSGSGHYDRFRHRLMFAVLDLQGRVIAFSGRALDEPSAEELRTKNLEAMGTQGEAPAKYVNSPESPIYRKREAVFGLYQARQSLRATDECVLVEGNFDVVSLHARGIRHVVAPLGTAFTVEQAKQIKRFVPTVTLLFDGDAAGHRAVRASREACRSAGLNAKVATLPEGTDPDELVRTKGRETLLAVLGAARGLDYHLIDTDLEGFATLDPHSQSTRIAELDARIAEEDDAAARALLIAHADREIGQRLGTNDARTLEALRRKVRADVARLRGDAGQPARAPAEPPSRARSRDRRSELGLEVLGALLDYPELLETPEMLEGSQLLEGDVALALAALRQCKPGSVLSETQTLLAKLPVSIHPFARARLAAPRHSRPEDASLELSGNLRKLKGLELSRQKSEGVEELERARKQGDFDQEVVLLREQQRRARERHGLGER